MKKIIQLFMVFIFTACNSNKNAVVETKDSIPVNKIVPASPQLNEKQCYANYSKKDSIKLELTTNENTITGTLQIKLFEKDENKGTFKGIIKGDTLVADYVFMSEGIMSTRQIAFIKRNNNLIEGYGDVEEKDGKILFKNASKLNFNNSTPLVKVICTE